MIIKKTFTLLENKVNYLNKEANRLGISASDVFIRLIDEKLGQTARNAKNV